VINSLGTYIKKYEVGKEANHNYGGLVILSRVAEILKLYRVDLSMNSLEKLLKMPLGDDKRKQIDKIIMDIVGDITKSLSLKLGSFLGNDSLFMSINDAIEVQKLLEGEDRTLEVIRIYADVVIEKKQYDLPKILYEKDENLYMELEKAILDRLKIELQDLADEVGNRVGERSVGKLCSEQQKILNHLDSKSITMQNQLILVKLIDLVRVSFTGEDDMTSKLDLPKCIQLYEDNKLVEELFNITRLLANFDDLIIEVK
jgi:hypothetical protein